MADDPGHGSGRLVRLLLEHLFRTVLGKPAPAAVFLAVNGLVLAVGERLRRRVEEPTPVLSATDGLVRDEAPPTAGEADDRLARLPGRAVLIGSAQILALSPGISRSGVTMVAGPVRGLAHEDAARFSFLLATPVILAAGALKIPDLTGPLAAGVHGPILAGSITSFLSVHLAVRCLTRYFHTRTLKPFAIYCTVSGATSLVLADRALNL